MKPLSFYGITSFAAVLLAGALVFLFVHRAAIVEVTELAQRSNLALAQTALNLVKKDVAELLDATNATKIVPAQIPRLPGSLDNAVNDLLRNPAVVRLKIYNRGGVVVFSTKLDQIGQTHHDNHALDSVMRGKVVSGLAYRNAVNPYDRHSEERDLIQTYLPVQRSVTEPILGALEIYTDAGNIVMRKTRVQREILTGIALVLGLLYLTLLLAARHEINAVDTQQRAVRARLASLESLSARLLSSEEEEKRAIALQLHEGVAQNLCSIKTHLEQIRREPAQRQGNGTAAAVIQALQGAIDDVRTLAAGLRPASLDQLGLLAAVQGCCQAYERRHPDISLEMRLDLVEDDVAPPLKIVVYRVVESTLANIARRSGGGRVDLDLRRTGEVVTLEVNHRPREAGYLPALLRHDGEYALSLDKIEQQVKLSGGSFSLQPNTMLGVVVRASWSRLGADERR
jgi:signal transduction histidine kinase